MDPIEQIREGMDVVNLNGEKVGTVKEVKMGDPQAATAEGQADMDEEGVPHVLANAFRLGAPAPAAQERLLRLGYIHVDGKGIGNNFFKASDAIERVDDDKVYLDTDRE